MMPRLVLLVLVLMTLASSPLMAVESGTSEPAVALTDQERNWLREHGNIRLGVDPAWEPFEYFDEQGRYSGMGADYLRHVGEQLGVPLTPRPGRSWPQVTDAIRKRELDLIPLIAETEARSSYLNFTSPYLSTPMVIFRERDAESVDGLKALRGKQVAVVEGYVTQELLERDHPDLALNLVQTVEAGLKAVSVGASDAFVGYLATGSHTISKLNLLNIKVAAATPYTLDLAMGVRKDWPELIPILEKALATISPALNTQIRSTWGAAPLEDGGRGDMKRLLTIGVPVVAAALLIIAAIVLANRRLQREVVERKQAEARLQSFAASASDWFWEMDRKLRFSYFSDRFTPITGVPQTALLGKTRQETGVPNVDSELWEQHLDDLANHRPFRGFVHPRVKDSGETVWLSISGTPAFEDNGTFVGYRGTGADVTEQVEARLRLIEAKEISEQAARAKSEFLANMSHEIRTPINGVLGMNEILLKTELSDKQRRCATTVRRSAETLLRVINDILDFSKIEAGKLELQDGRFDLRELIEDIGELFAEAAHSKGLELACSLPVDAHTNYRGDAGRLRQILTNLVGNAIKFTGEGEVVIRVQEIWDENESGHPLLRFEVQDTGIGIATEAQAHIFSAFAQADGSTNRSYGGTGLGLAIASQLTEMMGGEIGIESEAGDGARFWFTARLVKEPRGESTAVLSKDALAGSRILIVDDNTTNAEIFSHQLSAWNADFDCVTSGTQALEFLRDAAMNGIPYALVVIDMHMPEMDGITLARAITDDPTISDVRRVILSSIVDQLDATQYKAAGIESYLTKPVRQAEFFHCITSAVNPDENTVVVSAGAADDDDSRITFEGRVLLVEDNPVNQVVARAFLDAMALGVDVAEDGLAAIEMWLDARYDLLLMDCQMPRMDGFEATAKIRRMESEREQARTPIVALTANAMQGDRERCIEAGMDDYLTKPFNANQLQKILGRWLAS